MLGFGCEREREYKLTAPLVIINLQCIITFCGEASFVNIFNRHGMEGKDNVLHVQKN